MSNRKKKIKEYENQNIFGSIARTLYDELLQQFHSAIYSDSL